MCHGRKSKSSVFDLLSGAKVTISPWSIKATGIAAVLVALAFVLAFLHRVSLSAACRWLPTFRRWCGTCVRRMARDRSLDEPMSLMIGAGK
jgi:hypothetical protein